MGSAIFYDDAVMASVTPLISRYTTKRRTSRIAVQQQVGITGQDRNGQEFTVGGKATNLNLYGGSILLPRQLNIGSILKVRNNQKNEAIVKVVSQTKPASGMHAYGVQFVDDATGFWGIHFPPIR
jgi:hypothetical protein